MEIEGWEVYLSAYGKFIAIKDGNRNAQTWLIGDSLQEVIIKIDQANHPERCIE
jgi:hypothetical protein